MKLKAKPAPIQQFIKELKARETTVVEIRSPSATGTTAASAGTQASEIQPESETLVVEEIIALNDPNCPIFLIGDPIPSGWSKGALLNVRNRGDHYCITLYPEEYDPRHPERSMTFPNSWTCQDFVSRWYAHENPDPRAR